MSFLHRLVACCVALGVASTYAEAIQLTREEVQQVMAQAVTHATRENRNAVIAITDREGFVLGIWDVNGGTPPPVTIFSAAVSRAGTAAFLSSDQNAFTSRTAGFIIQQHFPQGVRNTPPGPLVGVGFSNLFYSDINRFKQIPPGFRPSLLSPPTFSPGTRGNAVALTSLNDSPGGVPLYKGGKLVGGIGVTGDGSPTNLSAAAAILAGFDQRNATTGFKPGRDLDEETALAGQTGFRPDGEILASNVLIAGIRIPYVHPAADDIEDVHDVQRLGSIGKVLPTYPIQAPPAPFPYPVVRLGGVEGEIRNPIRSDPDPGLIGKTGRLTAKEVEEIITLAAQRCSITRAGIRLPLGTTAKVFITVVNNPYRAGQPPKVLGCFRVGDATLFSWDVSAQKARTAVFFSNRQLATSCRTVGFLSQRFYPPGLDGRPHGPLFGFQEAVTLRLSSPARSPNPNLPNGMTIFPGGFPLYRDGALIGAIGISGDGVDQDDLIGASGCKDFLPISRITADNYTYRGARLPYAKFPRDPEQ